MATQFFDVTNPPATLSRGDRDKRYLFGPIIDFLCLGGSSLIILPLLLLVPVAGYKAQVAAMMLLAAHVINHPHFANSYQIFYRDFRRKAFTSALSKEMRARFIVSGIAVPALLLGFVALCFVRKDAALLGQGANLMALFVGWHYVKQGYGMLMVDAALKRQFFTARTKQVLLINCYAVWIAAWMSFNSSVNQSDLWGLKYYSFAMPTQLVTIAQVSALTAGVAALAAVFHHWQTTRKLPLNGLVAYVVSLYVWLLFIRINPLWGLVVPALHSIQYLTVVWRFQVNYETARLKDPSYKRASITRQVLGADPRGHLVLFGLAACILGFIGFWGLPVVMTAVLPQDEAVFGAGVFLFVFWVVVNVHHYFLDTVMWRRENPDTKEFLFS